MSLLAIFAFILRKLVTPWLFVLPLQICSLLLVYVSICFLSIIRVCKTIFLFLSISDFFVGTAVDTAAFKSCKSSLYLARLLLGFIVRVGNYFIRIFLQ
jgi:hypothetical protein